MLYPTYHAIEVIDHYRWLKCHDLSEQTITAIDEIKQQIKDDEHPQFLTVTFSVSSDPDGNTTLEFYAINDSRTDAITDIQSKFPACKIFQCKRDAYLQVYPDGYNQPANEVFILEYYELKGMKE